MESLLFLPIGCGHLLNWHYSHVSNFWFDRIVMTCLVIYLSDKTVMSVKLSGHLFFLTKLSVSSIGGWWQFCQKKWLDSHVRTTDDLTSHDITVMSETCQLNWLDSKVRSRWPQPLHNFEFGECWIESLYL